MNSMENKVAIVTGAASGIGLAIAKELAMRGVHVTLSDIDEEKGNEAAAELPSARFQFANIANEHDCQRLVADTLAAEGHVDILVNNAGIQHVAPITEFPLSKWNEIMEIMLTAPFLLTKEVLPGMYRTQVGSSNQYRIRACITSFGLQISIRGSKTWTSGANSCDSIRGSRVWCYL